MGNGVPGLVTKIDGTHAIMFHVEHSGDEPWYVRWRIHGPWPPAYLVWRDATVRGLSFVLASEISGAEVEVQWRPSPGGEWLPVEHWVLRTPVCTFVLRPESRFQVVEGFIVCAVSSISGVSAFRFPRMDVAAGEEVEVTAVADAPSLANLLFAPGEFRPVVAGVEITNVTPTREGWDAAVLDRPVALTRCLLSSARRWFAIGRGRVPSHLASAAHPAPAT